MADTLSRHENLLYATSSSMYEIYLEYKIKSVEKIDKEYKKLKEKTTENEVNRVKAYFSLNKKGYYCTKEDYIYLIQRILNQLLWMNYIKDLF